MSRQSFRISESRAIVELFCAKHHINISMVNYYCGDGYTKYKVMFNGYKKIFHWKQPITIYEVLLSIGQLYINNCNMQFYNRIFSRDARLDLIRIADPNDTFNSQNWGENQTSQK